jgi:type IV pilus assembly protein PilC
LIYPVAVVSIAVLVVVLLLWKVVPIFANMFAAMEVALPLPTRVVMGMSGFVQHYGILVAIFCVAGFFGLKSIYATPQGRYKIDKLMINLPVFGMILRKIAVARFTRTLGTLITSGVALLEALDITARTSGNAVVEEAILKVRKAIEQGRNITDPLRETEIFPNMVVQMIGVGEQTGAMDAMLSKIADFYEDEVDTAVGDMLTLMEPMIILMLGVSVGGIVISMYMPLFTLIGQLGK